jgi:hypothetical protein
MPTAVKQPCAPCSGRYGIGRLSLVSRAVATWSDRRPAVGLCAIV